MADLADGVMEEAELFVPRTAQGVVSRIHDSATVLNERHDERGTHLEVRGPAAALARLQVHVRATVRQLAPEVDSASRLVFVEAQLELEGSDPGPQTGAAARIYLGSELLERG